MMLEGKINWGQGENTPISVVQTTTEEKSRTMISAKIIADSTSYLHKRLTTFVLEYPRYIHSELLTHRVFSKNSASSRAIPIERFIKMVSERAVKPLWTQNMKGMQGPVITDSGDIQSADRIWLDARFDAIRHAERLHDAGIHKQNVNRLLEPWMYIRIILTTTDFENWFELRDHEKAHPEIRELAKMMKYAMDASVPKMLQPGEWHIPFGDIPEGADENMWCGHNLLKVSAARCARVSYNNFDGTSAIDADLILFDKLFSEVPRHCSPAEHQARVPLPIELVYMGSGWHYGSTCPEEQQEWFEKTGKYTSNLRGWIQLRKLIECGEFI